MFSLPRLAIYAAIAMAVAALAYKAYDAIGDAREAKLTKAWQAKYDQLEAESRAKEQLQRDKNHAASVSYEKQIDDLRRDDRPVPIVRLPKCARGSAMPSTATAGSEPVEAATDGLDRENRQARAAIQFSDGLREYAKDCKAVAIQLTEVLQVWPR